MYKLLGQDIHFVPQIGNLKHIKICEVLSELHRKRELLKKKIEESKGKKKLKDEIGQLEMKAVGLIRIENSHEKK